MSVDNMSCASDELHLVAPYNYIRSMPGKQVRSKLAVAFNDWLNIDVDLIKTVMEIVEILHNASLMIDDIEDNSVLRRGLPVTHSIYGTPRTINTANFMYFVALEKCCKLGKPEVISIFTEQLLELHRGQGKELFWRDSVVCPSEEEYEEMVLQKTGGLFILAVRLMESFSAKKFEFNNLLRLLALYFQIRDDYMNLLSDDMAKQKSFAEDLTEGKFSFPVIHSIKTAPSTQLNDDPVLNILRQRTVSVDVKQYCISLIKERGSLEYTLKRLEGLSEEIRREVEKHGGNEKLADVLRLLNQSIPQLS